MQGIETHQSGIQVSTAKSVWIFIFWDTSGKYFLSMPSFYLFTKESLPQKTRAPAIVMYNTICSSYHLLILVNERNQQITIKMN